MKKIFLTIVMTALLGGCATNNTNSKKSSQGLDYRQCGSITACTGSQFIKGRNSCKHFSSVRGALGTNKWFLGMGDIGNYLTKQGVSWDYSYSVRGSGQIYKVRVALFPHYVFVGKGGKVYDPLYGDSTLINYKTIGKHINLYK